MPKTGIKEDLRKAQEDPATIRQHQEIVEIHKRVLASMAQSIEVARAAENPRPVAEPSRVAEAADPWEASSGAIFYTAVLLFAAGLAARRFFPQMSGFFETYLEPRALLNPRRKAASVAGDTTPSPGILAQPTEFDSLPEESLLPLEPALGVDGLQPGAGVSASQREPAVNQVERFFKLAPAELRDLQVTLQDASRSDGTARQKLLIDLSGRLRLLCYSSRHRELQLAWQIAVCLEGLVKKLASSTPTVTASALRTAAGALEVLHDFALGGNLLVDAGARARLLVVDDDAVSRFAVCAALKDAFDPPELAPDGETGLSLATKQSYEAIFLDVEMPGMDGFELCTKIHNTPLNAATPVVFVTQHNDFESRAKAAETGGHDLIAKPFVPEEVKLKALTLVFRSRLERRQKDIVSSEKALETSSLPQSIGAISAPAPAGSERPVPRDVARQIAAEHAVTPALTSRDAVKHPEAPIPFQQSPRGIASNGVPARNSDVPETVRIAQPTVQEYANAHYTSAPTHLGQLKDRLQAAGLTEDPALRQDLLGEAYVGVHSLTSDAESAQAKAFARVGSGLQALLRKLLERTDACTPSRLEAATEALALLEELCRSRVEPLLDEPPVRILVVDDDPIALRALACAIQVVFSKPQMAHCGEEALSLASKSPFDLILLDVLMPGMDGFATCAKIRETALNERTPVVFVTSQCDAESRRQADLAGGCGFIPKPFLAAEIALSVLTFALRGRLDRSRSGAAGGDSVNCVKPAVALAQ